MSRLKLAQIAIGYIKVKKYLDSQIKKYLHSCVIGGDGGQSGMKV
jgi:hypothetical protein